LQAWRREEEEARRREEEEARIHRKWYQWQVGSGGEMLWPKLQRASEQCGPDSWAPPHS